MNTKFEQISLKTGFMKHNGGVLFRNISETEYEFKSTINKNHLNAAGITHGGYLSSLVDAGAGTAAHRAAENAPCVTISLELKFIGSSKEGDEILGHVKILKKTKTLVFLFCELKCNNKIITSATGVWKILKIKPSDLMVLNWLKKFSFKMRTFYHPIRSCFSLFLFFKTNNIW